MKNYPLLLLVASAWFLVSPSFSSLAEDAEGPTLSSESSSWVRQYCPEQLDEAWNIYQVHQMQLQQEKERLRAQYLKLQSKQELIEKGSVILLTGAKYSFLMGEVNSLLRLDRVINSCRSCCGYYFYGSYMCALTGYGAYLYSRSLKDELGRIEMFLNEGAETLEKALDCKSFSTVQLREAYLMKTLLGEINYKKFLPESEAPPLSEAVDGLHIIFSKFIMIHRNFPKTNCFSAVPAGQEHQYYEMFAAWGLIRHKDIEAYYNNLF